MQLTVKTDYDRAVYDKESVVDMMATIEAPRAKAARNAVNVVAVIDRSGSMGDQVEGGMTKLDYVRFSLYKMIDNMTDADHLALVFFDNEVVAQPFLQMTTGGKERCKAMIASTHQRGMTNISAAIEKANEFFANFEGSGGSVSRVMLLTDGDANEGATDWAGFEPIISRKRQAVGLSCFGYGVQYKEDLLDQMAKAGGGGHYYIQNLDAVPKSFAAELGGLLSCHAQQVVLTVSPHKGGEVVDVLNDFTVRTENDKDKGCVTRIEVGDIYAGERRNVVVRIKCTARDQALPRPVTVADVGLSFVRVGEKDAATTDAKVKLAFVKGKEDLPPAEKDKEVAEQVALLEAANAQAKAKQMADAGDVQGAMSLLGSSAGVLRNLGTNSAVRYAAVMTDMRDGMSHGYSAGNAVSKGMLNMSASLKRSRVAYTMSAAPAAAFCDRDMVANDVIASTLQSFTAAADPNDPLGVVGTGQTGSAVGQASTTGAEDQDTLGANGTRGFGKRRRSTWQQ